MFSVEGCNTLAATQNSLGVAWLIVIVVYSLSQSAYGSGDETEYPQSPFSHDTTRSSTSGTTTVSRRSGGKVVQSN